MYTIYVRTNETATDNYAGDVVDTFSADSTEACMAWFALVYDANDYTCSFQPNT